MEQILRDALKLLLLQTRKLQHNNQLEEVNKQHVSPLITEIQFIELLKNDPNSASDVNPPVFTYTHGFNPLLFLSEKIAFLHPKRVQERKDRISHAYEYLQGRSAHAQAQMLNFEVLKNGVKTKCAGLTINYMHSLAPTSIGMLVTPHANGEVTIHYTDDPAFVEYRTSITTAVDSCPLQIMISDLKPATRYYLRSYLRMYEGEEQIGGDFVLESCILLASKAESVNMFLTTPWILPYFDNITRELQYMYSTSRIAVLGSPFLNKKMDGCNAMDIFDSLPHIKTLSSLLNTVNTSKSSSNQLPIFTLSWNDTSTDSDIAIKDDERIIKKHTRELKKLKKSGGGRGPKIQSNEIPVLKLPPLPTTLERLQQLFPVSCTVNERQLYHSEMLASSVELYVLDLRAGYLGKHQSEWLTVGLMTSQAQWKIILTGAPLCSVSVEACTPLINFAKSELVPEEGDDYISNDKVTTPKLEHRVSITIEEPEERTEKYSLSSVLTAVAQLRADAALDPLVDGATLITEPNAISSGIVVLSGGKSKSTAAAVAPYVAGFSPSISLNDKALGVFAVEVHVGTSARPVMPTYEDPLMKTHPELNADILWEQAQGMDGNVGCKVFMEEDSLAIELINLELQTSFSDADMLSGEAQLIRSSVSLYSNRFISGAYRDLNA